jgi:hypothetical protein
MRNEAEYQRKLIKKLQIFFPGCFVLKNDPTENQGVPDILILFGSQWAMLEVKLSSNARVQPNQVHYINLFDEMSFASFISPENETEVLNDLQSAFGSRR